jgi:hypothetical protein
MEGCHNAIAMMWEAILGRSTRGLVDRGLPIALPVSARDVALCMVAVKLVREAYRHKPDNIADAHVYLDFASRLAG